MESKQIIRDRDTRRCHVSHLADRTQGTLHTSYTRIQFREQFY